MDLAVAEAQHAPATGGQHGVPRPVTLERRARAVVLEAIGLDDEPELGPAEVDAGALDDRWHERPGIP